MSEHTWLQVPPQEKNQVTWRAGNVIFSFWWYSLYYNVFDDVIRKEVTTINADLTIRVLADFRRSLKSCIKEDIRHMPDVIKKWDIFENCISMSGRNSIKASNNGSHHQRAWESNSISSKLRYTTTLFATNIYAPS